MEYAKYIKKPVIVEAIQFTRNNTGDVSIFTGGIARDFRTERNPGGRCTCIVRTLEGDVTATEGDYIIHGVHGEYYPCKPDIFMETYEVIE